MAAGGGGKKVGSPSGPSKEKDKNKSTQARDPAGPGGAIDGGSGTGPGAKSPGGGGNPLNKPSTRSYVDAIDDPVAKEFRARELDAQNNGESWGDGFAGFVNELGHLGLSALGMGERQQSFSEVANELAEREDGAPMESGEGDPNQQAHYGLDLGVLGASILGTAAGMGGVGIIADQISDAAGRPLDVDLGTSVFGSEGGTSTGTTGSGDDDSGSGSDDSGGSDDTEIGGSDSVSGTLGASRGRTKRATTVAGAAEVQAPAEGQEVTAPVTGTGVDIITQTGTSGPSINIPDAAKRRRRGTMGGLGMGGLAL